MEQNNPEEHNIREEFRNIGENLLHLIQSVWDQPERKNLTDEIVTGVGEMGSTIKSEIDKLESSTAGQQLKSDMQDFQKRIKSGELEEKIRTDLLSTLQFINNELKRVNEQLNQKEDKDNPENSFQDSNQ